MGHVHPVQLQGLSTSALQKITTKIYNICGYAYHLNAEENTMSIPMPSFGQLAIFSPRSPQNLQCQIEIAVAFAITVKLDNGNIYIYIS